jgi:hypothetical protein
LLKPELEYSKINETLLLLLFDIVDFDSREIIITELILGLLCSKVFSPQVFDIFVGIITKYGDDLISGFVVKGELDLFFRVISTIGRNHKHTYLIAFARQKHITDK